jgi:tetratricopeptide (TPR) repeat protein
VAYDGRAAAFEKMGDYARALADYNMLVFSFAVELDATDAQAEAYDGLVKEAIRAYRSRAACSVAMGNSDAARRDLKRADKLAAKLKKPEAANGAETPNLPGQVTIRNEWPDPVTVVIAGVSYSVPAGGEKTMPTPSGSFPYEMVAGPHRLSGTIEAGRTYSVKPPPGREP